MWKRAYLASLIGVRMETISKIERDAQQITSNQLRAFSKVFGVSVDELYEREEIITSSFLDEVVPLTGNTVFEFKAYS